MKSIKFKLKKKKTLMQHLKEIVLLNYPLILSLLKYRSIGAFFNLKIRNPNRGTQQFLKFFFFF